MKFKNLVKVVLAVVTVAAMGMTTLAAGSKEAGFSTSTKGVELGATAQTLDANARAEFGVEAGDAVYIIEVKGITNVAIDFVVPNTKNGDIIDVLHFGTKWEKVTRQTVANGKISVTFKEFSPVAFIVKGGAAKASPTSQASPTSPTSPKTGEVNMVVLAGLVAALATVSGVTAFRKKRA